MLCWQQIYLFFSSFLRSLPLNAYRNRNRTTGTLFYARNFQNHEPPKRSIRFASVVTESINNTLTSEDNEIESVDSVARNENEGTISSGSGSIVLKYRQYNLTSTPETTV